MCTRHTEPGQVGDGGEGGDITWAAVQVFHNRGNAAERDHAGAPMDSPTDCENKSVLIRNNKKIIAI